MVGVILIRGISLFNPISSGQHVLICSNHILWKCYKFSPRGFLFIFAFCLLSSRKLFSARFSRNYWRKQIHTSKITYDKPVVFHRMKNGRSKPPNPIYAVKSNYSPNHTTFRFVRKFLTCRKETKHENVNTLVNENR